MKKLLFLLFPIVAIIIDSCTMAGNVGKLTPTETTTTAPFVRPDLAKYETKYAGEDGVYLFRNLMIEHSGNKEDVGYSFLNKWYFHRVEKYQYVILNTEAEELTTFTLNYLPDNFYITVFYPDETEVHFGAADFLKMKGDFGADQYKFALPKITKGTVVEFGAEETYNAKGGAPLQYDIDLQYLIPCESLNFSFAYPSWWKIQTKKIALNTDFPYETSTDSAHHKIIMSYIAQNVPAFKREPYSPYFRETGPYFEFQIIELLMGQLGMRNRVVWSQISKKIYDDVNKNSLAKNQLIQDIAAELTRNMTDRYDKLDTVISYVKGYEVDNGSDEMNIAKIVKKKRGNSFGLTILAAKLLEKAGILTQLIFIHSAEDGYFDYNYVDYSQLSAIALVATIDNRTYIICPYIEDLPPNLIPDYLQKQPALVIAANSADPFWTTPLGDSSQNQFDEVSDMTIGPNGTIGIREKRTLRGLAAYVMRKEIRRLNYEERRKAVKELIGFTEGEIMLDTFNINNLDHYKEPLLIETEYHVDNQVSITPDEAIFQTGGLLSPLSKVTLKIKPEERINPIKIPYDQIYNRRVTIHFPPSWTITTPISDISFSNIFGSINGKSVIEGDSLVISQNLIMKRSLEPKEKITDLLDLTGRTSKLWIPAIVFGKQQ